MAIFGQDVKKVKKLTFFLRGLNHGFGPKMAIFPSFFFGNIGLSGTKRKHVFRL